MTAAEARAACQSPCPKGVANRFRLVPSSALTAWTTTRAAHIDDLLAAHTALGGSGPGRRWRTEQLNWATTLALAAEFQGYCRDLHDLTTDEFAQWTGQLNGALQHVITARLTEGRQLDRGNAHPGSLGSDFGRFGLQLWKELARRRPARASKWREALEALNDARNGIAHADASKIAGLVQRGYPLSQLRTTRRFRGALDGLAPMLDDVVADHLGRLFQVPKPW